MASPMRSSARLWARLILFSALTASALALPSVDGHEMPPWAKWIFIIIGIVGGSAEVFYGYKLFRFTLFLAGFFGIGTIVFLLVWDHAPWDFAVYLGLGLGVFVGSLAGGVAAWIPKIGVFFVGGAAGAVAGFFLNTLFLFKISPWDPTITLCVACIVLGLAGGILAIFMMRIIVVFATSIIGSFMVVFAFGNCPSDPSQQFPDVFHLKDEIINGENLPVATYGYLAAMAILAVSGVLVQFCITARKKKPEEKDEWEEDVEANWPSSKDKKSGGKDKKGKKGKKDKKSKKVKADALLRDYEQGGEFYEEGYDSAYYNDGSAAAYANYGEDAGYDEYYEAYEEPAASSNKKAKGKKSSLISW